LAFAVVAIFMLTTGVGIFSGNWQNDITKEEFLIHHKYMNSYGHPTGTEAVKKFNEDSNLPGNSRNDLNEIRSELNSNLKQNNKIKSELR